MYTSGIHAGIQTAHLVHEMMRKYQEDFNSAAFSSNPEDWSDSNPKVAKYKNLIDWADNHKTIIVKCGGYHSSLVELYGELKEYSAHFKMPMGRWRESKDALNNAQTAVGIVVPDFIYNFKEPADYVQTWPRFKFADESIEMAYQLNQIINRYRMAT